MTDERRDDEILGRALSRAIETIDVNQTPFERSRIATAPAGRSIFGWSQLGFAVVGILLAVALGSWLARSTDSQTGVAASPTASPVSIATPLPSPQASAVAVQVPSVPTWVYFPRDGLPPAGAFVSGRQTDPTSRSLRIGDRISALRFSARGQVPTGATNPVALIGTNAAGGSGQSSVATTVTTQGDVATVEFGLIPGWGVRGAAQSEALLQQLVYTITEEPGITRALITETGKPHAVIDQLVVDKPLSREDVSGYAAVKLSDSVNQDGPTGGRLSNTTSTDKLSEGLTRFVVTAQSAQTPRFSVQAAKRDDANTSTQSPGKYLLSVQVVGVEDTKLGLETFDSSPLRGVLATASVATGTGSGVTTYELYLDDLRPWRVFTLASPTRIVIDIGGAPRATSDRIAVYGPTPGSTIDSRISQIFTLSGAARVFEANVAWRLKDATGKTVANGHFLASLGSSALWGTFDTRLTIPTSLIGTGHVTLELYEASPKDGTEQGLVVIPLMIR
jgi:hypothetical protein